jgi:hypothetical protein
VMLILILRSENTISQFKGLTVTRFSQRHGENKRHVWERLNNEKTPASV